MDLGFAFFEFFQYLAGPASPFYGFGLVDLGRRPVRGAVGIERHAEHGAIIHPAG